MDRRASVALRYRKYYWEQMEAEEARKGRLTSKYNTPDEKFERIMQFELDDDGKSDSWNGYVCPAIDRYEARDKARKMYLKQRQLKMLQEKNDSEIADGDGEDNGDHLKSEPDACEHEENVFVNNHTAVWGSWWKDHQWGYKCCKQLLRNSCCTAENKEIERERRRTSRSSRSHGR